MDFDKPFRTFEELAVLLRDEHGLAIGNIEETVQVLRFIPYYDLVNGYKDVLMEGVVLIAFCGGPQIVCKRFASIGKTLYIPCRQYSITLKGSDI